jgi:WD40 repeat protein
MPSWESITAGAVACVGVAATILAIVLSSRREDAPGSQQGGFLQELWCGYPVYCLAYSPDGKHLASAGGKLADEATYALAIWDAQSGQLERTLRGHESEVYCLAYCPNGRFLASGSNDGTVRLWNVETGEGLVLPWQHEMLQRNGNVHSVAFSRDGTRLAAASALQDLEGRTLSGEAIVWEPFTRSEVARIRGHLSDIGRVALSPDGHWIATGGAYDEKLYLWDVWTTQQLHSLTGTGLINSVSFNPDGSRLMSCSEARDNAASPIQLWDPADGQALGTSAAGRRLYKAAFHPDGRRAVAASDYGVDVWDPFTGQQLAELRAPDGYLPLAKDLALSADGMRAALAHGASNKITLWSLGPTGTAR